MDGGVDVIHSAIHWHTAFTSSTSKSKNLLVREKLSSHRFSGVKWTNKVAILT
jgi:hypothetical protein